MARPASVPTLRQLTLPSSALLVVGAGAWVALFAVGPDMRGMAGTMGLSLPEFILVWAAMMAAMMLPTVTPFAALYTRTLVDHRARRITGLAVGYLLVWTLGAVPAYALARLGGQLAVARPEAARLLAVIVFVSCGVYQLTPLKDRCLARCRSPLGFIFKYAGYRGSLRDLRVGMNHGAACVACCWGLMGVLVAVGMMNPLAMVALTAVVLTEKTWLWGRRLSRGVGIVCLVLAVVVVFRPSLAGGLYQPPNMDDGGMASAAGPAT
jgi:predicted metal-binding membrane protein